MREGQIIILNQILIISMHIASLVKRPCYLLKLSSRNENMGVGQITILNQILIISMDR